MVYALLCSAIVWNLGTWYFGLPSSSSHTLIGSIIGVGVANALLHGRSGTSGVDWDQAVKVGYALLLSPVIGFICAAVLLLAMKALVRNRQLYQAPEGNQPPPAWIRGLLILTCTGVSFAHGSNDGQKGMGLIMLILVGTMPIAYALNRSLPPEQIPRVAALTQVTEQQLLTLHAPQSKVLAASFKTPRQALDCLLAGCESITLPLDVAQQFITSPAVDAAIVKFEQDWQGAFRRTSICRGCRVALTLTRPTKSTQPLTRTVTPATTPQNCVSYVAPTSIPQAYPRTQDSAAFAYAPAPPLRLYRLRR